MNASLFLILIGSGFLVLSLMWFAAFTWSAFLDWRHAPHFRSFCEGQENVRNRLVTDSWWFGESPETQGLLADLGCGVDVSRAREKWRKARAKAQEQIQ
jgi:hypothetical protein